MGGTQAQSTGPDLSQGLALTELKDGGMLVGHLGGDAVLLARHGEEIFAIGANCSHYHGPLVEGLMVEDTVRCPWHHACFSLRTGEAIRAPALSAVACWRTERRDGKVFLGEKIKRAQPKQAANQDKMVIVGAGAAGFAAAEMLRREGFAGSIALIANDEAAPYDRPNLSKDYLAGKAPEEWIPLRSPAYYQKQNIDLQLGATVAAIDIAQHQVRLADGRSFPFTKLLLATGAEPVKLSIPGAGRPHVYTLRSLADSRAIIAAATNARSAVVLGASFIGLEVAASLRERGLEVHVAAPEAVPMERILGAELGQFIRMLHESQGVIFHLGETATSIEEHGVTLKSGTQIGADLVVAGIGVRPRTTLAEAAGLKTDRGVLVDAYLETSAPGIFAAGDIARWPDPHSGDNIRIEHWVVAERQGQAAARNMLGRREAFTDVPFFWSQHYDVTIAYVGHAASWDAIDIEGSLKARDCALRYRRGERVLAVATIFRDIESLEAEVAMERTLAGRGHP